MDFFLRSSAIRLLRGGSGGGRGGGSSGGYSGGSSSSSGSYHSTYGSRILPVWFYSSSSSNGTGQDKIATWVWIVLSVVIMLILGCCCYCIKIRSRSETVTRVEVDKDPDFEAAVSEARRNIAYVSSPRSCGVRYQTYGGTFDSKYVDRGKTLSAVLTLRLVNDGIGGYTVEGEGNDSDGISQVTDGFITYDGSAWWLEEIFSGIDTGLKVLSKGTFDFADNKFSGTWRSSSQNQGDYVSFVGRDITKTMASRNAEVGIPTVEAEVEGNLPVAVAIADAPVMATPQVSIYK